MKTGKFSLYRNFLKTEYDEKRVARNDLWIGNLDTTFFMLLRAAFPGAYFGRQHGNSSNQICRALCASFLDVRHHRRWVGQLEFLAKKKKQCP